MVDSGKEIETRCYHCAGPLTKNLETNEWTVAPFIRDSFCMIGSAVGGTASAFIGFNHVMPIVRKCIKGPMWLHFLVGAPLVIVVSISLCWTCRWRYTAFGTACLVVVQCSSSFISASTSAREEQNTSVTLLYKDSLFLF